MVEMARKIIFRDPKTGKTISREKWEELLIEGKVEVTTLQQNSKAYRRNGKVQSKTRIERIIKIKTFIEDNPKYTFEKIIDEKGREWFLTYDGKPTNKSREQQIDILREKYKFKNVKTLIQPSRKDYSLLSYIT